MLKRKNSRPRCRARAAALRAVPAPALRRAAVHPRPPGTPLRSPIGTAARALLLGAAGALVATLLAACLPPQADYRLGLGTNRIRGSVTIPPGTPGIPDSTEPGGPLVVAYLYHHQFVTSGSGAAVLVPTARVLRPGPQGDFSLEMSADVVRAELMFIAPGHLTQLFHFQRQLGVGDIDYRAELLRIGDWRSHYYTYLSPQLENLILERRYRLSPSEQQTLGQWLQLQNEQLGAQPSKP